MCIYINVCVYNLIDLCIYIILHKNIYIYTQKLLTKNKIK